MTSVWPFALIPGSYLSLCTKVTWGILKYRLHLPLCILPRRVGWVGMGPRHEFFKTRTHTHPHTPLPTEDSVSYPAWERWSRPCRVTWGTVTTWWQCCSLCLDGPAFFPISEIPFPPVILFLVLFLLQYVSSLLISSLFEWRATFWNWDVFFFYRVLGRG